MRAMSELRSCNCSLSIARSRLIGGIGAALIGGSTAASCCADLRDKGFSRSHAYRIVRNAARLHDFDTAASQQSKAVTDVIDRLLGGSTPGECKYVLREKGFSSKQTQTILRNAKQGAARQRDAIQLAAKQLEHD